MYQKPGFETIPFELPPELLGEQFNEEDERGRQRSFAGGGSRYSGSSSRSAGRSSGPRRPPITKDRAVPRFPRRPGGRLRGSYGIVSEPYPGEPGPSGSEHVRWIKDCLNQAMDLQLPVTGVMGSHARSAVRRFQRQQGIRDSGIVGPDTEEALKAACGSRVDRYVAEEMPFGTDTESWLPVGVAHERAETELPRGLAANYQSLRDSMLPKHRIIWDRSSRCYPLSKWKNAPAKTGVYLLIFPKKSTSGHIGYIGRSQDLYKRMRGYRRDLMAFGLNPDKYAFCWHETPQYKSVELSLRKTLIPTGKVANQLEFEIEQGL